MPTQLTPAQILALAPDSQIAKDGQKLATPRHWVTLGHEAQFVWGECQGSAKNPYQAKVDLSEPAFSCTCPSRKFPCKHGIGLLLLLANQSQIFTQTTPPQWLSEWQHERARRKARVEKRANKNTDPTPNIQDAKAQARRMVEREAKVAQGLADLETWLHDVARQGLATAQSQPSSFWETPAKRLVDAQAPSLARRVRELGALPATGEGWQARLLERMGRIHLLLEAYRQRDTLPAALQADIRALIGWTMEQDEVLATQGVRDCWGVLGQRIEDEEKLRVQRTWLWGCESGRHALVLSFAPNNQMLDKSLVVGTQLDAELVFFPSVYPLRALVKTRHAAPAPLTTLRGYATLLEANAAYAAALTQLPWLERMPFVLQAVTPVPSDRTWRVRDAAGYTLPLAQAFTQGWQLIALSGGHPLTLMGEWDGDALWPLSGWAEGRCVIL
jgi:hypothetical protein